MSWLRSESPANAPSSSDQDESDAVLVAQSKLGDPRAFALLYRRYVNRIYGYCRLRLATTEDAEDATQTVFIRALRSIETCRDGDLFAGWLFAIARNVITDSFKPGAARVTTIESAITIEDPSRSPEDVAIAAEWTDHLERLKQDCLVEKDREVLDLRLQGLNDKEIAVATHRTHGAIRNAQYRLLRRLRECLGLNREVSHVR